MTSINPHPLVVLSLFDFCGLKLHALRQFSLRPFSIKPVIPEPLILHMHKPPNRFTRLVYRLCGRDPFSKYYTWLIQFGRITEGQIMDFQQSDAETTIYYNYKVANVDYETSQRLSCEQIDQLHRFVPGARITVRYDPKNPGISIVP